MNTVMLCGSRSVTRLPEPARVELERLMHEQCSFLLGDANGADKAFQTLLQSFGYRRVVIFCSGNTPRNNIGGWELQRVKTEKKKKDYAFYAAKDRAMVNFADAGLFLWDGKSSGTLMNVWRMCALGKPNTVFTSGIAHANFIRSIAEFDALSTSLDPESQVKLRARVADESKMSRGTEPEQQMSML